LFESAVNRVARSIKKIDSNHEVNSWLLVHLLGEPATTPTE